MSWAPRNAVWMPPGDTRLAIVGESFYQDALRLCVDCDDWGVFAVAVQLRCEPDNAYDPLAVACDVATGQAGYIGREHLPRWRQVVVEYEDAGWAPIVDGAIIEARPRS